MQGRAAITQQDGAKIEQQIKPYGGRWQGCKVVCIASGPSLTQDDCNKIHAWKKENPNARVIAVNNCYSLAHWADIIYSCDYKWWDTWFDAVRKVCFSEFWTINERASKVFGINYIRSEAGGGLSGLKNTIRQGGNSGFQALSLALNFGASEVVLVGYDMQFTGNRTHWHGDHPQSLGNPVRRKFLDWIARFEQLQKECSVPIVNCSRQTALTCFERADLSDVLKGENHESVVGNT